MNLVGEQRPVCIANDAAQHTEVDIVCNVGASHLPLHDDGLLLRACRCLHLADVAASRQVAV